MISLADLEIVSAEMVGKESEKLNNLDVWISSSLLVILG